MNKERLYYLLEQYAQNASTESESGELWEYIQSQADSELFEEVGYSLMGKETGTIELPEQYESILKNITGIDLPVERATLPAATVHRIPFYRKWSWVAASVLIALSVGTYFYINQRADSYAPVVHSMDILPGKDGAILTLADGSQVSLDTIQNGVVALQGGAKAKIIDSRLIYEGNSSELLYNTMSTPKGRQFQLTLPDGTKVWLNNASSIRYPVVFTGNDRTVAITGEVYFEVAKQTKMPFRVNIGNQGLVEVLGTHFNINAYQNERTINTTLLEGAVRVQTGTASVASNNTASQQSAVVLKPGQQAQLLNTMAGSTVQAKTDKKQITVLNKIDTDQIMAWKNGLFNFNNMPFDEAMRQLERWYDIEVVYEKGIPDNIELNGEMTKGITLNDLLIVLQKIGVKCRLDGKKLLVSP